jgi:hypothetical protein
LGSEALGGILFPVLGLKPLIFISALFSLFTLLVLPYLAIPEELSTLERAVQTAFRRLKSLFSRKSV